MQLSIQSELVYSFADSTQIIANIEASHTSDQVILSEALDIQPPVKLLSDKSLTATAASAPRCQGR